MTSAASKQAVAEANRRRYEELRAAGQEAKLTAMPSATALDGAPIAATAIIGREEIPADWYAIVRLRRGEALRISDPTGLASVAMIGWREEDTSERINCADTVKVQWSAAISRGSVIFSDMGRVMFSLIEDSSGAHDLMVGGSTPASAHRAQGSASGEAARNTQENFVAAAAKAGLSLRDIPPCVSFFAPVTVDAGGRFLWNANRKRPGDFVDLRAEMNALLVLSNCAHPLDPARPSAARPVVLVRYRAASAAVDDACRMASPEAMRAFEFTDRLYT